MSKIVFSHSCNNGTHFSGATLDLSTPVNVKNDWEISNEQRNADFMEFGGWHCLQIRPELNGFQGYDTVIYSYQKESEVFTMTLELGDPNDDGHGLSEIHVYNVNKSVEMVRQAYKDSCKKTGISFNHNEDYTESGLDWRDIICYRMFTEYEQSKLSETCIEVLEKFNFPDCAGLREGCEIDIQYFTDLWWWFIKLSLPDLVVTKIKSEAYPSINSCKELNVQFAYGLFLD